MPTFARIEYELPDGKKNETEEKYIIRVLKDIRSDLKNLDQTIDPNLSLKQTLEIIRKGKYEFIILNPRLQRKRIDLNPAKRYLDNYEINPNGIERLLEDMGQLVASEI